MAKSKKERGRIPFWYRLFGYAVLHFEEEHRTAVLNAVLTAGLPLFAQTETSISVPQGARLAWEKALTERQIVTSVTQGGLPTLLKRYRLRVGLVLGALLAALVLFLGASVAWDVEVEGARTLYPSDIEADLAAMGVGIGSFFHNMDFEAACNEYRLRHPEVAWMGIYRQGTVLRVKILETDIAAEEERPLYANIVAAADGVIESVAVIHGTAVVKAGQSVKKGDLLVSGLLKGDGVESFVCAEAEVIGRREESISVFVPYEQTRSIQGERVLERYLINFFGKTVNISINSGKIPESYGTIVKEDGISLSGGRRLPVSVTRVLRVSVTEEPYRLSQEEATRLAYTLLKNKLSALLNGGSLLSKSITATATEEGISLQGTVSFSSNIAKTLPFSAQ
ncbi:MAG: sporulation protein YqfD [Clostridia bacterium]|nr:sporulation protein YqfD [Clostridia bacterium]